MIQHWRDLPNELDIGPGVLVIGSGPAGLVIARRLSEMAVPVCVLEAGELQSSELDKDCLNVEFEDQALQGVSAGRTRQLGGGLNLWGGQLARFHPAELKPTTSRQVDWPICERELAAPTDTAMRLLGQAAWPAAAPAPIRHMQQSLARHQLEPVVTTWLRAPKWTRSIWNDLTQSPTVRIVLGWAVDGINLDRESGRVTGVTARSPDGGRRVARASTVVIAAGAIESVRILLQPDDKGRPQPWHSHSWLGRGFCEHLDAPVATLTVAKSKPVADMFDPSFADGIKQTWKLFSEIEQSDGSTASGVVTLGLPGNIRNALSEFRMLVRGLTPRATASDAAQVVRSAVASAQEVGPLAWRYLRHKRLGTALRGEVVIRASIEQQARWDNRITLAESHDRLGIPRAKVKWRADEQEGKTFLSLAERVSAWLEEVGAGRAKIDPLLRSDPAAFAMSADDGLHHAGGARISANASTGVVDSELAVHETPGLYVCGACVFPRAGFANPTLMSTALGVRLADQIAARQGRGQA